MVDIEIALETRIDSYKRAAERTRKQAYTDDQYGYHGSCQFNKGQQFAFETIVEDLESLLARIRKEQGNG